MRSFFRRCRKILAGTRPRLKDQRDSFFHQTAKLRPEASESTRFFLTGIFAWLARPVNRCVAFYQLPWQVAVLLQQVLAGNKSPLAPPPSPHAWLVLLDASSKFSFQLMTCGRDLYRILCVCVSARQMTGRCIVFYWSFLKAPNCLYCWQVSFAFANTTNALIPQCKARFCAISL